MTHDNHMLNTQLGDGIRQNANSVDVVGNKSVRYVAFSEERSGVRIKDGAFRHTGVTRWANF